MLSLEYFFKSCKTLPLLVAFRCESKTFCRNTACRAGTTIDLLTPTLDRKKSI